MCDFCMLIFEELYFNYKKSKLSSQQFCQLNNLSVHDFLHLKEKYLIHIIHEIDKSNWIQLIDKKMKNFD